MQDFFAAFERMASMSCCIQNGANKLQESSVVIEYGYSHKSLGKKMQ
jgi:hypothetical protein